MVYSRTGFAFKNIVIGISCQIFNVFVNFASRYFFLKVLSIDYLGLNALFFNILQILSLVELGAGQAIVYRLYKPLKEGNHLRINQLMLLYKKIYSYIGISVFMLGLLLMPFLSEIVPDNIAVGENIYLLYFIFVLNSASSYFYIYKQSLIIADQKSYIINIIQQVMKTIQAMCQIAFLLIYKSFICYILIQLLFTILSNIVVSKKVVALYPFLNVKNKKIDKDDFNGILKDVKSIMIYKLGYVLLNNSQSILISMLISLSLVGYCSNYGMIIAVGDIVVTYFFNSFSAGIGNLSVDADSKRKENVFYDIFFLSFWFSSFISVSIALFSSEFITIWLGRSFVIKPYFVIAYVTFFFIKNIGTSLYNFRVSDGLFEKARYSTFIAAVVNIPLMFFLVKYFDLSLLGIYFSSSLVLFLIVQMRDLKIVFEANSWKKNKYLGRSLIYLFSSLLSALIANSIIKILPLNHNNWIVFGEKVLLFACLYNILYFIFMLRVPETHQVFQRIKNNVLKRKI